MVPEIADQIADQISCWFEYNRQDIPKANRTQTEVTINVRHITALKEAVLHKIEHQEANTHIKMYP